MQTFILAVLLAVMQASPQVPRHTPSSTTGAGERIKQGSPDYKTVAVKTAAASDDSMHAAQTNQKLTDGQRRENTQQSIRVTELPPVSVATPRRDLADWGTWFFNWLLAVTSVFLVIVGILQVALLRGTLTQIQTQAGHMERQNQILEASVAAAQLSARVAMGAAVPTLRIASFELVGDWRKPYTVQSPRVNIVLKNYGATPAFLFGLWLAFVVGDIPDSPDYKSYTLPPQNVVPPNGTISLLQGGGLPHSISLTPQEAAAVREHNKAFSVCGRVGYEDIFDSPRRELVFWELLLNFLPDGSVDWFGREHNEYRNQQS